MSFLDLAKRRYATKKYDPAKKVSAEQIEELKEIIRLSPSSINSQPWKFTFVTNEVVKRELASKSYMNENSIKDVGLLVVFSVMDDIEHFLSNAIFPFCPNCGGPLFTNQLSSRMVM